MLTAENVKGFDKLIVNAELFRAFLNNFYNSWGLEARETIVPLKVAYKKDKANGAYLRFDYEIEGKREWLHVKGPNRWY